MALVKTMLSRPLMPLAPLGAVADLSDDLVRHVSANRPDLLQTPAGIEDRRAESMIVGGAFRGNGHPKAASQFPDVLRVARHETPVVRIVTVLARIRS